MVIVHDLLLVGHLIGFAMLLGGCLAQIADREPLITGAMFWGTIVLVVTGVVLAGADVASTNWTRNLVKLAVWLPVAALVFINRRWTSIPRGLLALITALVLVDLGVATLWH